MLPENVHFDVILISSQGWYNAIYSFVRIYASCT